MSGQYKIPEYRVHVDQLVPGVFIRLESLWFNHPFLFNKFKIKDMDQIRTLRSIGVTEVICVPERSDRLPKSPEEVRTKAKPQAEQPAPDAKPQKDPYTERLWRLKKEQIQRLKEKRESIARCEANYLKSIGQVPNIMNAIMGGSQEAVEQASQLASELVQAFQPDQATVLHLMDIKATDEIIYYHSLNVSVLALLLGREMGLNQEQMTSLALGCLLHDIGKNRIEKKLLRKPPPLTKPELKLIQLHPRFGVEMLLKTGGFGEDVLQLVFQHHERMDGKGYPRGLTSKDISRLAQVCAIANFYDNLVNDLDPSRSMTPYQALSVMYAKYKTQIDMNLFSSFIRCLGIYPPGTIVQLSNNVIGMVIAVNQRNPLKPSLLLYDPEIPRDESIIFDMEDDPDLAVSKSIHPAHLPKEIYGYLNPRTRVTYFMDNIVDQAQGGA